MGYNGFPDRKPTAQLKTTTQFGKEGRKQEAEQLLQDGKNQFPFGRCEFSTNLAVIYYTDGRKEAALRALEETQSLVNRAATSGCIRSLFLLGSLYKEMGRNEEAQKAFRQFLADSENSTSQELQGYRRQLGAK